MVNYSNTGIIPIYLSYHVQVLSTGTLYYLDSRDFAVASGSSLVLPRAAADTRGQYSTLHYTGGSIIQYATVCYAGAAERGAGEEERRRDEGMGDGAKEVA